MHALTRDQFLEILGLSSGAFDQLQYEGGVALAFGSPIPGTPGRYLDLDLVAMWIALGLTDKLKRDIATTVVLGFFTNWVRAVARTEADRSQDFFFAIGALGVKDFAKRIPKLYGVADGTRDEINEDFDRQPEQPLVSALFVNVSDIVRRLQERAHSAKFCSSSSANVTRELHGFGRIKKNLQWRRRANADATLRSYRASKTPTQSR